MTFNIPRIRAFYTHPPIPTRSMDWQAYYDGDEPNDDGKMAFGTGSTETEAVTDLIENHPRAVKS
jgi:hypothetical protein